VCLKGTKAKDNHSKKEKRSGEQLRGKEKGEKKPRNDLGSTRASAEDYAGKKWKKLEKIKKLLSKRTKGKKQEKNISRERKKSEDPRRRQYRSANSGLVRERHRLLHRKKFSFPDNQDREGVKREPKEKASP